ncbi:GNAT family N-acetyltransferase [Flaviaesturariibacter aridisoli]|uniref:N-acetyltransferase n=1 Tax=Flaviaesturariibacter aridisoli TaxID=2545761 RepID=A0A4R4DWC1_9BACT|nr:GNAT family N-acetyltransferase [Flaviaesturariibacter aridisoli]TCZ68272.1 N-acetyltransferase [Flaviaesturariibacter aridisoli]
MIIQHKQDGQRGLFFLPDGEEVLAEMTYIRHDPTTIIIDHTEVDEDFRGQNVGYQLVEAAVEYARQHQLKIVPVCMFAAAVFQKKADYQDVLKEEQL